MIAEEGSLFETQGPRHHAVVILAVLWFFATAAWADDQCGPPTQDCPDACVNGCGNKAHQCPVTVQDMAVDVNPSDIGRSWDVDLAPHLDWENSYRLVWEQGWSPSQPDYQDMYRVWVKGTDSGEPSLTCDSSNWVFDADTSMCRLGKGGNPEVFGDYVVWAGLQRVHWIASEDIENGYCCRGDTCDCCQTLEDEQGLTYEDCVAQVGALAAPTGHKVKAAVTDGRVMLWWDCVGECNIDNKYVDIHGCVIDNGGCIEGENNPAEIFVIDGPGSGPQRRPRIVEADTGLFSSVRRSMLVYEDCPIDCGDDCHNDECETWGVYLYIDATEPDNVVGQPFPINPVPTTRPQHWPDVEGDLVVWDQNGTTGGDTREIWACEPPTVGGVPQYELCQQNVFRLSEHDGTTYDHFRPTVWSGSNLVAWSRRTPLEPGNVECEVDVLAGRLERSADGTIKKISGSLQGPSRAVIHTRPLTNDEARQKSPRIADTVVFWSDTAAISCDNGGCRRWSFDAVLVEIEPVP